jgi:hypothetical protein
MVDSTLVGVACDFNWPKHVAAQTADAVVWSCNLCHAVACSGCHVG